MDKQKRNTSVQDETKILMTNIADVLNLAEEDEAIDFHKLFWVCCQAGNGFWQA